MTEVLFYIANDGKHFKSEDDCKKYEETSREIKSLEDEINNLKLKIKDINISIISKKIEGNILINDIPFVYPSHHMDDGKKLYGEYPHCHQLVGGQYNMNTTLKIYGEGYDTIYQCEKCTNLFRYK